MVMQNDIYIGLIVEIVRRGGGSKGFGGEGGGGGRRGTKD